ncbi:DUF397 domain-containing protein [Spirillospora sp. CA-253888]
MRADHVHSIHWKRSSLCGPDQSCVEVARLGPEAMGVRDSVPDGTHDPSVWILSFGDAVWRDFLRQVRKGAYDL